MIPLDLDAMVAAAHRLLAAHGLTVDGAGDNDRIISPAITSARDVLALADALATAERERDELLERDAFLTRERIAVATALDVPYATLLGEAVALRLARLTAERDAAQHTADTLGARVTRLEAERVAWEESACAEMRAMEAERDAAVTGHAALAAAVRAEREARRVARLAQSERDALEDDAWPDGDDDERAALAAAGERLDTAEADHDAKRDHLTALLAGAPCGYVEARVVRAYLAAVEAFDGGALGAPCRASACAAIVASVATGGR